MSDQKMLRFLARGTALVPHYEAQEAGQRRFHGWKHDATQGPSYIDPETKQSRNHGAFTKRVGIENVIAVPTTSRFRSEYVRHLREGDLWPADEFTAQQAGVPFDPSFGGEHDASAPQGHEPTSAPRAEEH